MKDAIKLALAICAIALIIYGAFSLKIWACKSRHPQASTVACLF